MDLDRGVYTGIHWRFGQEDTLAFEWRMGTF